MICSSIWHHMPFVSYVFQFWCVLRYGCESCIIIFSTYIFFFYIQTVQTRSLIPQAQANDMLYTYKRMSAISVTMFLLHLNRWFIDIFGLWLHPKIGRRILSYWNYKSYIDISPSVSWNFFFSKILYNLRNSRRTWRKNWLKIK